MVVEAIDVGFETLLLSSMYTDTFDFAKSSSNPYVPYVEQHFNLMMMLMTPILNMLVVLGLMCVRGQQKSSMEFSNFATCFV